MPRCNREYPSQRVKAAALTRNRLDELKAWIAQRSWIQPARQILMTAKGKQARFQGLFNEVGSQEIDSEEVLTLRQNEVFVYDRDLLAPKATSSGPTVRKEAVPEPFAPESPPEGPLDENSLQSWQQLLRDRRNWAVKLLEQSDAMLSSVFQFDAEILVVRRATAVAVDNVRQHISSIFQRYRDVRSWARDILKEQNTSRAGWDNTMRRYSRVTIDGRLKSFFKGFEDRPTKSSATQTASLQTLASIGNHQQSATRAQQIAGDLRERLSRLEGQYEDLTRDGNDLVAQFNQDFTTLVEDTQQASLGLEQEVEVIVKKINSDYENARAMPQSPKSLSTVTRTAMVHSQEFLPSLQATMADIDELLHRTIERKNTAMERALTHLQKISAIQSAIASFQPRMSEFELNEEDGAALDAVAYVEQLPSIYGSLLIEAVRRQEWSGKMKADSSTLAEEMAAHGDDEERRRRKWFKTVKEYLNPSAFESKILGIEVNVKDHEQAWPPLSREDIEAYKLLLKDVGEFDAVLKGVEESAHSLDAPSKQQLRHANAQFKNGSIHGAAYGRNTLLLRGDDELIQTLQNEKTRLEERFKGSESRVRKLEDLLHRQSSQMQRPITSRPSSSGLDRFSTSPVLPSAAMISHKPSDADMRRPSMGSRPVSATFGGNDKALLQRVVMLEGELEAVKAKSARMEEHASSNDKEQAGLRQQVQDATSTKRDLMDNFEAQQQEFDNERRLLRDDNRKLKIRLEEMEEELDRALGSHENTKFNFEKRHQSYNNELSKLRSDSAARGEAEREHVASLQDKIRRQEEEVSDLKRDQESQEARLSEAEVALKSAHVELSPEASAPRDFTDLAGAVELLSQRASNHLRDVQLALDNAQTEKAAVEHEVQRRQHEISTLQNQLLDEQNCACDLRQELAKEKARSETTREELNEHRCELSSLQSRFEDNATGPDALQTKLASEEQKVESLHIELATAKAAADQSELELSGLREQIETLQAHAYALSTRLQNKGERAGQVTFHLFSQVDRLKRVLESIGYSVTREFGGMVIQRIPRSAAAAGSTTMDPSQPPSASTPGPYLPVEGLSPPDYLHWAMAGDEEQERNDFEAFILETEAFDMDAFSEAVPKRVKDVEHIARKWQREAKSYREKFHRAQLDGQAKIAFRSFKEGDLALFLPTRNQTPRRPWAAFNVGAPHYFLREQHSHKLKSRDFLLARISRVEERVVDLGKDVDARPTNGETSAARSDDGASVDEYNPFGLSDGLRWYFLDAAEDKLSAPTTPGLGKTTVASAAIAAEGSIGKRTSEDGGLSKTLAKSLDSRRSSTHSRQSFPGAGSALSPKPSNVEASTTSPARSADVVPAAEEGARRPLPSRPAIVEEDVRRDQLLDP